MNKLILSFVLIFAIVAFNSCDEPVRTVLTKEEKKILDSLYAIQISGVRKKADSICDARYKSIFNSAKDSFYQSYVREIEAIINGEG